MLASVTNALRVVDLLSEHDDLGVSEIGRALDLTTATAHRLVTTLVWGGLAERDSVTRRYRLGPKLLMLANRWRSRMGLRELLMPVLLELADQTAETVNLGIYRDGEVVYVEKVDSSQLFRIDIRVGAHVPAHCTALGKALLAYLDAEETRRYLKGADLTIHTPNTLTSVAAISTELLRVRERGYALDRGELLSDVWCVAAPVFEDDDRPAAAISVSVPRSRFDEKREQIIPLVVSSAEKATATLRGLETLQARLKD